MNTTKKLDYIIGDNTANVRKALAQWRWGRGASWWPTALARLNPARPEKWMLLWQRNGACSGISFFQSCQNSAHWCTEARHSKMCLALNLGNKSIPAAVNTRWSSTLNKVKAILQCDHLKLSAGLGKFRATGNCHSRHGSWIWWRSWWTSWSHLVKRLIWHRRRRKSIGAVVPSILSFKHHLEKLKPQVHFLSSMVTSLQASLKISWNLHECENGREARWDHCSLCRPRLPQSGCFGSSLFSGGGEPCAGQSWGRGGTTSKR